MSLAGKLEDLPFSDLVQVISTNGKSGKLALTRHDAQGVIVFRHGKIIYAASSSARETLGFLLLSEGLISEEQLVAALEGQHRAAEEKRLGSILLEEEALSEADLERVVRHQLAKVVTEFMDWRKGFFRFEPMELPDRGEISVDAVDLLLPEGLRADQVLVELGPATSGVDDDEPVTESPPMRSSSLSSLKTIMGEIRSPEFTGEATRKILAFARTLFSRGALFFVQQNNFNGIHQFGILSSETSRSDRLRNVRLPLDQPSILSIAAERQSTYRGPLEPIEWNLYLVSKLGGMTPSEAAAIPLVVNSDVLLVLYGDNAPSGDAIGPLDEIELLLNQAGLAMEKRLLEKRIEQYQRLRGLDTGEEE